MVYIIVSSLISIICLVIAILGTISACNHKEWSGIVIWSCILGFPLFFIINLIIILSGTKNQAPSEETIQQYLKNQQSNNDDYEVVPVNERKSNKPNNQSRGSTIAGFAGMVGNSFNSVSENTKDISNRVGNVKKKIR